MSEDTKIMDTTKTDFTVSTVSDDSDSGLQIDETSCSLDDKVSDTPIPPTEEVIPLNETNGATQHPKEKSDNLENIIANEISNTQIKRKKRRRRGHTRLSMKKGTKRKGAKRISEVSQLDHLPGRNIRKAIERFRNLMDIECHKCLFCPFVDSCSRLNLITHVQNTHKEKIDNWCSCCNEDGRLTLRHRKKCRMIHKCPFCRARPVYFSEHVDFKNHLDHLETHYRGLFHTANPEDSSDHEEDDNDTNSSQIYPKRTKDIVPPLPPSLPPSLPPTDDDYIDSENISLTKVPRMHVSVTGPKLKQFPWELVVDAVKRAEQLFYGNRLCIICHELANGAMDLGLHMLRNHSKITNGKWCHVCNQLVTGLFDHLQNHKRNILKCSLCSDCCESFSDLRSHLIDHSVYSLNRASRLMPKWFLCRKCPKAFPEEIEYNRHLTQH